MLQLTLNLRFFTSFNSTADLKKNLIVLIFYIKGVGNFFSRLRLPTPQFFSPDSDSSIFFLSTPTPQNMPGLPTPKTCLSYDKI